MVEKNKILLLLSMVFIVGSAYDEYVHPHYTYSCEEDKSIIIRGISDGGVVTILGRPENCSVENITSSMQQVEIKAECLTYTYITTSVWVSIWDQAYDGTRGRRRRSQSTRKETLTTSLTGSQLGTLSTPLTGSQSGTLSTPLTGSQLGTLSTPLTGSQSGTLSTSLTGSQSGTLSTPLTGSQSGTLSTPLTGSQSGTLSPPLTGSQSGTLSPPLTGSQSGTLSTPLTGSQSETLSPPLTGSTSGVLSTRVPPATPSIKGGHGIHYFNLTCNEISPDGVDRMAENQMHLKDLELKNDGTFEVDKVKMTFRKKSYLSSERLTRIYTGDELFMFLEYTGTSSNNYVVMPKTCTAIPGNNVDHSRFSSLLSTEKMELWNYTNCVTEKAQDLALMENFEFYGRVARVKMYGFHFEGVSDISIVCNVTVCRSQNDTGCKPHHGNGCPLTTTSPKSRRKRRTRNIGNNLDMKLKQRFFIDHESLMQHKNTRGKIVREKRSAQKGSSSDTMVYNTIRVFDTDFDVSSTSFLNPLPIMAYFACFLLRHLF